MDSFDCKDLRDKLGAAFFTTVNQLSYLKVGTQSLSMTSEFATAAVANNAECVKNSVTYQYFGRDGSSGTPQECNAFTTWIMIPFTILIGMIAF